MCDVNETQYRINIDGLRNALKMIHSEPEARLEIEPGRVALVIQGEYAWVVHGQHAIAGVLARTVDRYYGKIDEAPVEPVIPIPGLDGIEQVVREMAFTYNGAVGRIYQGDKGWGGEFTLDSIQIRLKEGSSCPEEVRDELEFIVNNCHNFDIGLSEMAEEDAPVETPFAYQDAVGRIFQRDEGWYGEITFRGLQIKTGNQFTDCEAVGQELMSIIDSLSDPLGIAYPSYEDTEDAPVKIGDIDIRLGHHRPLCDPCGTGYTPEEGIEEDTEEDTEETS